MSTKYITWSEIKSSELDRRSAYNNANICKTVTVKSNPYILLHKLHCEDMYMTMFTQSSPCLGNIKYCRLAKQYLFYFKNVSQNEKMCETFASNLLLIPFDKEITRILFSCLFWKHIIMFVLLAINDMEQIKPFHHQYFNHIHILACCRFSLLISGWTSPCQCPIDTKMYATIQICKVCDIHTVIKIKF